MAKPQLLIFASGTKIGGGSGFENLVKSPDLQAEIVGVVSNHEHGGVRERAERLDIPFIFFYPNSDYKDVVADSGAEWVALSGWMKQVQGLDPARTFNIHPALLSFDHGRFGGKGMYGRALDEAVKAAFDAGEISESGFSMHFVTEEMDRGPVFFEHRVPLSAGMSANDIAAAVKAAEHAWQPKITNMVVHGQIKWDGHDPKSLVIAKI